ncbi:MAG: 50S ribosomal protein L25 [Deltaproteobacteria bacterium]|nr:50S ribosomal protein L25 [Deltaproteobacteria bacterium]
MAESTLNVSRRDDCGKGVARSLRRQGLIPAVFYGRGLEGCALTVDPKALKKALATESGMNTLIRLQGEGPFNGKVAIVKNLQKDALTRQPLHADFQALDLTRKTVVAVPVKVVGKAAGEKNGGILQLVFKEIEVRCLPTDIPPFIEVDVAALGIGDSIHIADVALPGGIESTHEENFAVVSVAAPVKEEAEAGAAAAAEGAAAPEGGEQKAEAEKK